MLPFVLLQFLLPLLLVDDTFGTCSTAGQLVYVQYFLSSFSLSVPPPNIENVSSLCGNFSGASSGSDVDTDEIPASCSLCANNSLLCDTLDDAFSLLEYANLSPGPLYSYIAVAETVDTDACQLKSPHTLSGSSGEITIQGFGNVSIECAPGAGLLINSFNTVYIEGIAWNGCGPVYFAVKKALLYGALVIVNSYNLTLSNVGFVGSSGSSVIIDNDFDSPPSLACKCTFQHCHFSNNIAYPQNGTGGGVYYFSTGNAECSLTFADSSFVSNSAQSGGAVSITSYLATKVEFLECNFTNNTATDGNGSAVFVRMHNSTTTVTFENSIFTNNHAVDYGGAIYVDEEGVYSWMNCTFLRNSAGGGGALYLDSNITSFLYNFTLYNCSFTGNHAQEGGAVYLSKGNVSFAFCEWEKNTANSSAAAFASMSAQISITNCHLWKNSVMSIFRDGYGKNCIMNVDNSTVLLTNVTVENNFGSGLCSNQSKIVLYGINSFAGNLGYKGGGINLVRQSLLHLQDGMELSFERNSATYGGGLYQTSSDTTACVFNFTQNSSIRVTFQDNYGYITGNSIYFTTPNSQCSNELENLGIKTSGVTSPAANLSFLNDPIDLVLGQPVTLNASITDYFSNPTNVYVDMFIPPPGEQLDQSIPYTLQGFHGLTIQNGVSSPTVYVTGENKTSENCVFCFESSTANFGPGVNLHFNILPCPVGFVYISTLSQCTCTTSSNLYCNYESAFACVLQGYWHGSVNGSVDEVHVTAPCYSGYCENIVNCTSCENDNDIIDQYCRLPKQDSNGQCSANRQGILCTECQANYSFTFGAIKCVSSDTCTGGKVVIPFLVIVVFEVISVAALVIVLKLGYRVNSAYVFGFVYYYSILQIVLPAYKTGSNLLFVISIFESITQLNPRFLGYANICFTRGMTTLEQEVLQYINPILITLLVLGFVILRKFCSKYVNFKDNTPVRAICLLILLSFTALSLTSYRILTPLTFPDVNQTYVNIEPSAVYFSEGHLYFFIVAVLVMVMFVLPFTVFLLLAPFLMRVCNLMRIKPFLDEFQGCYKDRYRWMAGFYFLCRLIYLLFGHAFILLSSETEYFSLQLLSFAIVVFHLLLQPYKEQKLNFADTILLADITLITLLYGNTADILFAGLQSYRNGLTYFLMAVPVLVLLGLFLSSFDLESFRKKKKLTFVRRKSSRRRRSRNLMTSTITLLRPLIDGDSMDGSQYEDCEWQYREPVLGVLEPSGSIQIQKSEKSPDDSITMPSPATSSIIEIDPRSHQESFSLSTAIPADSQAWETDDTGDKGNDLQT